jgi:hypothetical protein
MNYIGEDLYQAYFDALDSNIEWDGADVPVYTVVPPSASPPYIYLNDIQTSEGGTKDAFIHEADMIIDIITNDRSKKAVTSITDDLLGLIKTNRGDVLDMDNFTIISMEVVGQQTNEYLDDENQFHIITNTIRINHQIEG